MAFAEGTEVSTSRSREEIEKMIRKHGARQVGTYTDESTAVVTFKTADRMVKFTIPMPEPDEATVRASAAKRKRPIEEERERVREQEERRRWRCLVLVIKAKLEGVANQVETFDEAFLAHIVTGSGRTILEELKMIEKSSGQRLLGAVS